MFGKAPDSSNLEPFNGVSADTETDMKKRRTFAHASESEPDRIIRASELQTIVPYSSMHIWRLEKAGRFPARIHLGPNRVGWSLREVSDWLAARKAERPIPPRK